MDFQFILPEKTSDLLRTSGDRYFVRNVYNLPQIKDKLEVCKSLIHRKDANYIIEHFDTYYSVIELKETSATTIVCLMRAFDLIHMTVKYLVDDLAPLLSESNGNFENRTRYLNVTKMTLFLAINIVKRIDAVVVYNQQQQLNQQKKRGKPQEAFEQHPDWERKRQNFLMQLYQLMDCQLEKLWNPPVIEENFVNMICDICYRTIETTPLRADTRSIIETCFQVFGIAIKRYNHALTFTLRILQILRTNEPAAHSIPIGVNLLYEEFNITSIFANLITEIVESLTVDAGDTAIARNFSMFLSEFAAAAPTLVIPHLSLLADELLNCESHVLRNCVLQIMGDAIVGELTSEDLNDEMKEARNEFLTDLLKHTIDVSAHVRAKVLHIWHNLKVEGAVPLVFQLQVITAAVERLKDKTSIVRKQAVQLIKSFLECNPFSSKLSMDELVKQHEAESAKMEQIGQAVVDERKKAEELNAQWSEVLPEISPIVEEQLQANTTLDNMSIGPTEFGPRIAELLVAKKYKEAMAMARQAEHASGNSDLTNQLEFRERCAYYEALLKSYLFLSKGCKDMNEELGTQIKVVQFLEDSINFSKVITKAVPRIQEMLLSKTNTDVFEAVDFFTTGYLFGIKGTESGMRMMLNLVYSSDKEKRDAISNAYRRVLFTTDLTDRAHAVKVVQNLSCFLEQLECGHQLSFQNLVNEWVATDDIDANVVQVLFERFTMKLVDTTANESRLALQLLIMCSQAKSSIASSNIAVIESIGLGERGKRDPQIYTACLEFMTNSIDADMSTKYYKRYDKDAPVVQKIIKMFHGFFFHPRIKNFDSVMTNTMDFIFKMCQAPDVIAQEIVLDLVRKFQDFAVKIDQISASQQAQALETPYSQPIPESQPLRDSQPTRCSQPSSNQQFRMPGFLLTRFIIMIGCIAIKEMIFLDIDVYNNQKFRQELREGEEKKKKNTAVSNFRRRTNALNMSATESLKRLSGTAAEPQQEPDEDLVGATAEDNIAEMITHICEDVLLSFPNALLAKIYPFVIEICKYPAKYRDQELQQAATLTLIRFMCISSHVCEANLPFLMNILTQTKNITIKCNIVIGLSDLTFRFPNLIEPWTGHFYSTLHEDNTEVRLTAVKMLSHLILHEMIRVKGQIASLALCIVDTEDEIRNITLQFFKEIAHKSNILYNVMPDIISKLGDPGINLEEEKYRIIMRYILGLIQKDKQVETLVEKLCLRFDSAHEERQCRDIAYCLSLLTYNERAIKKLIENTQHYKDKVQIDEVYQSFKTIISNTLKLAKPELKAIIAEFEKRLNELLEARDSTERDGNAVEADEGAAGGDEHALQAGNTRRGVVKKKVPVKAKRNEKAAAAVQRRGRDRAKVSSSSSSEDEAPRQATKGKQKQQTRQVDTSTSSSETELTIRRSGGGKQPTASGRLSNRSRNKVIEESISSDEERPKSKRDRRNRK